MTWVWITGLIVLGLFSWSLNFISLPGNWGVVVLLGVYAWLGPDEAQYDVGWPTVAAAIGIAILGEAIELTAAAASAKRAGGATRSGWFALIGSIVGTLIGATIGIPVPVIGPVIGAVLFAGLGAMAGAIFGEWSVGKPFSETMPVGKAAFWGRLIGLAGKLACGFIILIAIVVGLIG